MSMFRLCAATSVCVLLSIGCATTSVYSVAGDSTPVGHVDQRFDAEEVDVDFRPVTGEDVGLSPDFKRDITRRLGALLPTSESAPAAPRTKLQIATVNSADRRVVEVTMTTAVGGTDVVTKKVSPDFASPWAAGVTASRVVAGGGAACMVGAALVGAMTFALGQPVLALFAGIGVLAGACVALPGAGSLSLFDYLDARDVSSTASAFFGDVLREHAGNIFAAAAGTSNASEPTPPAAQMPDQPPAPAPKQAEERWFVGLGGAAKGPLSADEVRALHKAGKITLETLVWKDGMPQWISLRELPALQSPAVPPPLPSSGPSSKTKEPPPLPPDTWPPLTPSPPLPK